MDHAWRRAELADEYSAPDSAGGWDGSPGDCGRGRQGSPGVRAAGCDGDKRATGDPIDHRAFRSGCAEAREGICRVDEVWAGLVADCREDARQLAAGGTGAAEKSAQIQAHAAAGRYAVGRLEASRSLAIYRRRGAFFR